VNVGQSDRGASAAAVLWLQALVTSLNDQGGHNFHQNTFYNPDNLIIMPSGVEMTTL
jgi:hypothetical protein